MGEFVAFPAAHKRLNGLNPAKILCAPHDGRSIVMARRLFPNGKMPLVRPAAYSGEFLFARPVPGRSLDEIDDGKKVQWTLANVPAAPYNEFKSPRRPPPLRGQLLLDPIPMQLAILGVLPCKMPRRLCWERFVSVCCERPEMPRVLRSLNVWHHFAPRRAQKRPRLGPRSLM